MQSSRLCVGTIAPMPDRTVRDRSRGLAVFSWVFGGVWLIIIVGAMIDPTPAAEPGWARLGWLFLCWAVWMLARCMFVGVTIADGQLVRHGWIRCYRYPAASVSRVRMRSYSGWFNRFSEYGPWQMVSLDVAGPEVRVPELIGRESTVEHRVRVIAGACGIEPPGPGVHRET